MSLTRGPDKKTRRYYVRVGTIRRGCYTCSVRI